MACSNCGSASHAQPVRVPAAGNGYAPLCAPQPSCSACGELECLCRPLWTAGMIVSEDDLNRLDRYMLAKQRLHNRQLHGTGVVAGLVVTCHPCEGGQVQVSQGYAIGPCGEDIVVCNDDVVDICALIQKCRAAELRETDCRPWGFDKGCQDLTEDWILAVRYDEQPARNAPMLRAGRRGDCGCGCGGKGESCGCGGHGGRQMVAQDPSLCAPSVICETYRYEVFRKPEPKTDDKYRNPLLRWLLESEIFSCLWDLIAIAADRPKLSGQDLGVAGRLALLTYCQRIKTAIAAYAAKHGSQHCAALVALCQVPCPDPRDDNFLGQYSALSLSFLRLVVGLVIDCICLKLLPAVQPPASDPRIPLAMITVDLSGRCRVTDICNWTPLRPIVLSATAVEHWLRLFGIPGLLHRGMAALCCAAPQLMGFVADDYRMTSTGGFRMRSAGMESTMAGEAAAMAAADETAAADGEGQSVNWGDGFTEALMRGLDDLMGTIQKGGFEVLPDYLGAVAKRAVSEAAATMDSNGLAADPARVNDLERRLAILEGRFGFTPSNGGDDERGPMP